MMDVTFYLSFSCRESTSAAARSENGSVTVKDQTLGSGIQSSSIEEKFTGLQIGRLKKNPVTSIQKTDVIQNLGVNDFEKQQAHSGPLLPHNVLRHSLSERGRTSDR